MSIWGNCITIGGGGGGGGDVPLLTSAQWSTLTTAQKQAYNLVAIQKSSSGFKRGTLVNGADYVPVGIYLPDSDESNVICEAYVANFASGQATWGYGTEPVTFANGTTTGVAVNGTENAVYIPMNTNSLIASVDLGATDKPFTAYLVIKLINPGYYSRVICCMKSRSFYQGFACYGSTFTFSTWGNQIDTGISTASDYVALTIRYDGTGTAIGYIHGYNSQLSLNISASGRYVTIARSDTDPSTSNAEPCDCYVRYFAVVDEADTATAMESNLANIYSEFVAQP